MHFSTRDFKFLPKNAYLDNYSVSDSNSDANSNSMSDSNSDIDYDSNLVQLL